MELIAREITSRFFSRLCGHRCSFLDRLIRPQCNSKCTVRSAFQLNSGLGLVAVVLPLLLFFAPILFFIF
jgi:hypothetical protein